MWVRIDDRFVSHPKVAGLSDRAFRLYVSGLCYAAGYLTDGHIPKAMAKGSGPAVAELVEAELWATNGTGWRIHDWLDYNPSAADVEAKRELARERKRRYRRNGDDGRYTGAGPT